MCVKRSVQSCQQQWWGFIECAIKIDFDATYWSPESSGADTKKNLTRYFWSWSLEAWKLPLSLGLGLGLRLGLGF